MASKPQKSVLGRDMFDRVVTTPAAPANTPATPRPKPTAAAAAAGKTTPADRRVGTITTPYQRADGQQTRQVSCTLPIDLVMRLELAATRRQVRVRDLIVEMIEQHYPSDDAADAPAATPAKPRKRGP